MVREFTIRPDAENVEFLETQNNKNGTVNVALQVYRRYLHGELTDTKAVTEGREQFDCLFDMPTLDEKAILTCPVKAEFPSMCSEDKIDELLSCCRQCPRKAEYLKLVDLKAKYPSAFKEQQEQTESVPTTDTSQERHEASAMVKAAAVQVKKKEGWQSTCYRCGQTVYYHKSVKSPRGKYIPLDNLEERKTHDCPKYEPRQRPQTPVVSSTRQVIRERMCLDCGKMFTDEKTMRDHVMQEHKRYLATQESWT